MAAAGGAGGGDLPGGLVRRACVEVGGLGCGELAAAAGACRGWAAALAGAAAGPPGRLGLGTPLAHRLAFPLATPPGQADPWEPPRRCLRLQGGGGGGRTPCAGAFGGAEPFTPSPGPAAQLGAGGGPDGGHGEEGGSEGRDAPRGACPSGSGPEWGERAQSVVLEQFQELVRGRAFLRSLEVMAPGVPPALLVRALFAADALTELRLEDAAGSRGLHGALEEALAGGAGRELRRLEVSFSHIRSGADLRPLLALVGRLPHLETLAVSLDLPARAKSGPVKELLSLRAACRIGLTEVRVLASGGAPLRHLSLQRVTWNAGLLGDLAEAFPRLKALSLDSPRETVGGDELVGGSPGDAASALAAFPALERACMGSLLDLPGEEALAHLSVGATSLRYLDFGLSFQPAARALALLRRDLPPGIEEVYVSWAPATPMHGTEDGDVLWHLSPEGGVEGAAWNDPYPSHSPLNPTVFNGPWSVSGV